MPTETNTWSLGCPVIPVESAYKHITITTPPERPAVVILTLHRPPENRLDLEMCKEIIAALRYIEGVLLQPGNPGAVIVTSSSDKFFCTGLEFEEESEQHANSEGFFPLLATILDFPWPLIGALTGHTFGGGYLLALCLDYRIMNSDKGFVCIPAVDLGLHFNGIGAILKSKLKAEVAAKMLLRGHRWTGKQALHDGLVDEVVEAADLRARAITVSEEFALKAQTGIFGLLRYELVGLALDQFKAISHVHRRRMRLSPSSKI